MIHMQGKGVSAGVATGALYFLRRPNAPDLRLAADPAAECDRLRQAQQEAAAQLRTLAENCRQEAGDDSAELFETHAMLAEDKDYSEYTHALILKERCSAEYAVHAAGEHFADTFSSMDDAYMQARAADIRDVSRRILAHLQGVETTGINAPEPVIIAADDLAPSETVQLDRSKILGFVTRLGSENSHTAILARAMGIPAVCGLGDQLKESLHGQTACMDGETGIVVLEPDESTLAALRKKNDQRQRTAALCQTMVGKEDVTLDGQVLRVYCNIGSPEDMPAVLASDAQGVGLFRSEFLYLHASRPPSEESQFQAYKSVAAAMPGKRVIIRTLDVGADKQVAFLGLPREANPALGVRAIRLCLKHPALFRTQLRALYRASAHGRIAIMFPMITSLWEVRACKQTCQDVMAELTQEGIPFNPETELGVMIETPAAVLIAQELAKEVDFFSIGTNDLTQYLLACDRQASHLDDFFDPHHPSVLRALTMTVQAAHKAGIWVGICGELGADLRMLPTFLALGVDELSVSPAAVLPLRAAIRNSVAGACRLDETEA